MQVLMWEYPYFDGTASAWPDVTEHFRRCQNPKDWMNWPLLRIRMHMN